MTPYALEGNVKKTRPAYTVQEAARIMNVHVNTVYRLIARGELKSARAGRTYRIPASELAEFEDAA